ncbi:MAG TPA: mechanosensitive ion channel family protein [Vicinamibacterales bacterium]|jgi:small-conductance mechanosensitive channel|nr:mechanosensitive ion channel family protein [Vicinamibacterales bacterium]
MLGIMSLTVNRLVRRKLRLSIILLLAYVAIDVAIAVYLFSDTTRGQLTAFAKLALAASIINAAVFLLVNPLRADRVPEKFPTILQDAIVIVLVLLASTFLSQQLVTTSAVSAVVIGFALQDTLGNAFAGLAIQSEKPFHVGHWVRVGDHEGRVAEVTWRATKLRTKAGNFVILPNNVVAKEAIVNYSEPAAPLRLEVEVGASYLVPPNQVKAAIMEALRHSSRVLTAPSPDVVLLAFEASAITYKARFWIDDYQADEASRDEVRTAIYYSFQRHGIDIPWPIQVQYEKEWKEPDVNQKVEEEERLLAGVDLFATLPPELRSQVARSAPMSVYGSGETIVREGEEGQSMFVVVSGSVSVVLEPSRDEVARIDRGGYFGEMSLLTGEPRSATVVAIGDVVVVEIAADLFRRLAIVHPEAIEKIGLAALVRRAGLEQIRSATAGTVTVETTTLVARMKKFLRIS